MKINHKKLFVGLVPAAMLAMSVAPLAFAADAVVARTSIVSLCGKLFELDANAAGLTAEERARIVQKNLDNALIHAKNRTPSAVRVQLVNRNPVVTLDGFHIVTADGNSAARHQMTQMELAHKWADSISFCLADASAIKNYLAMLTGQFPERKAEATLVTAKDRVAVATTDMLFPMALATPLVADAARIGDNIEAVITQDVPLGPDWETYIPKGTIARGSIRDAHDFTFTDFPKNGRTISFYELRTPDGKSIPIDGHVYGGLNNWRQITSQPVKAECCGNVLKVSDTGLQFKVRPAKGVIVGAWKGQPMGRPLDIASRFLYRAGSGLDIAQGETMMLQLNATSAIAVAGSSM